MLIMRNGKRQMMERIELTNKQKIRTLGERENYKYLVILEAVTIKRAEMKNIKSESLRQTRKLSETQLYCRNFIKGINIKIVSFVNYLGPFLKWTREELQQIDQRTGKLMMMHKVLHPRDDIDRLYVSRKEGGRKLISIENSVDTSIR